MGARTAALAIVVCALATTAAGPARAADVPEERRFDGYSFVLSYYDDNIYDYSDEDIQRFEAGDTSGKYPIASISDFVTTLALRGDYRWDIREDSLWRLRLFFDTAFYAKNTDRSNQRFAASLQRPMRTSYVALTVGYLPDYLLRYLYWRPMPERPAGVRYAPAVYDRLALTLEGRRRLSRRTDGVLVVTYAHRDYEFPFDERDSNAYLFSVGAELGLNRKLATTLMLAAELTQASGADASDPAVDDTSNNRFGFELEGIWRMNRWLRFVQTFGYDRQDYTTNNVVDVEHYDRVDHEFRAASQLQMKIVDGWQPEVFFQYRASDSTVPPGVAEFGAYEDTRLGLQVTYYF